jgi:hypothetical protein
MGQMNRPHDPAPVDWASESAAGEEDPGASVEPMAPGDEAPRGAPGTGEKPCPRCGGSGKLAGVTCPECQGTGKVNAGIGGA